MPLPRQVVKKSLNPNTSPSKIRRIFTQSQGHGQQTAGSTTSSSKASHSDDRPRRRESTGWTLSFAGAAGIGVGAYITNAVYVYNQIVGESKVKIESTEPDIARLEIDSTKETIKSIKEAIECLKESKTAQPVTNALKVSKSKTPGEVVCFVIGYGIDASHEDFEDGQVLELSEPQDGSTPVLQKSTFQMPKDLPEGVVKICMMLETKIASIVGGKTCGVAPGTKLVDVRMKLAIDKKTGKLLEGHGQAETLRAFERIKLFVEANPGTLAVVNYSHGTEPFANTSGHGDLVSREQWQYPRVVYEAPATDALIKDLYKLGVLVVAAVGNSGIPAHTSWPSSNPYVISIGATDKDGNMYGFNNLGAACTLTAPTHKARAAAMPPNEYVEVEGTSYAAPFIAGVVCQVLEKAWKDHQLWIFYPAVRSGAQKTILEQAFNKKQLSIFPSKKILGRIYNYERTYDEEKGDEEKGDEEKGDEEKGDEEKGDEEGGEKSDDKDKADEAVDSTCKPKAN